MNFVSLEEKGKKIFAQFPGIRRFLKEFINWECMQYQMKK